MQTVNKKAKILLIDDDEIHLEITEEMLKDVYEIFVAQSGRKAIELLAKGLAPNLILLDVMMPDMNGWETLSRIKAISFLHNSPIAFVTSLQGESEESQAKKVGAADFITKPFDRDDIIKRIEALINKK